MRLCSRCRLRPAKSHRGRAVCSDCAVTKARVSRAAEYASVPPVLLDARRDEMTQAEVASVLGISRQGVQWLEKRALARFLANWREMFGE